MRTSSLLGLVACADPLSPQEEAGLPGLAGQCTTLWPPSSGLGPEEQLWAQSYLDHVSEAWGVPAHPYLQVRQVLLGATSSEHTRVQVKLETGWVASVYERVVLAPGSPSTVPQIDITVAPRPWSEVHAFVADCEDELQVHFEDPWCRSYVTFEPEEDPQGVRFDFSAPLVGNPDEYAYAYVYAWGSQPDRCGTRAYSID